MLALGYRGFKPKDGLVDIVDIPDVSDEPSSKTHEQKASSPAKRVFRMAEAEPFEMQIGDDEGTDIVDALLNTTSELHMLAFIRRYGFPIEVTESTTGNSILELDVSVALASADVLRGYSRKLFHGMELIAGGLKDYRRAFEIIDSTQLDFRLNHASNSIVPMLWFSTPFHLASIYILQSHNNEHPYVACDNCGTLFVPSKKSTNGVYYHTSACKYAAYRKRRDSKKG